MAFNPNEHLLDLQGKDYLEVKWRIYWFNDECKEGKITILKSIIDTDREIEVETTNWVENTKDPKGKKIKQISKRTVKGWAYFEVRVEDGKGRVGEDCGSESAGDFGDYIEKAKTKATGRALALIGYGTQFTGSEFDESHRIVDAPVDMTPKTIQNGSNGHIPTASSSSSSSPAPVVATATVPPPVSTVPSQQAQILATQTLVDTRWATQQRLEKELCGPFEIEAYLSELKVSLKMEDWTMQQCHAVIQKNLARWIGSAKHKEWEALPSAEHPMPEHLKAVRDRQIKEIQALADGFKKDFKVERPMLVIRDNHRMFFKDQKDFNREQGWLSTSTQCSVGLLDRLIAIGRTAQELSVPCNEFTYVIPKEYDMRLVEAAGVSQAETPRPALITIPAA